MALDRQTIERRDFPIGRRGYEPEAVDMHLQQLADEVETLKRAQRPRAETLAVAASEQVRAIVEAAESSASEITRQAETDARRIAQEASKDADEARSQAIQQAREHVQRVAEATAVMLQRVDSMDSELSTLVESLRTGANRVSADLALLQGSMGDLRSTGSGPRPAAPAPAPVAEEAPAAEEASTFDAPPFEPAADIPEPEPAYDPGPPEAPAPAMAEPEPELPAQEGDPAEGARLIALNMALNGSPREETDRYLAENFDLADRESLLDDVYARVGG